jgi:hypothetical protein
MIRPWSNLLLKIASTLLLLGVMALLRWVYYQFQ